MRNRSSRSRAVARSRVSNESIIDMSGGAVLFVAGLFILAAPFLAALTPARQAFRLAVFGI